MIPVPAIRGNKIAMLLFCYASINTSLLRAQCVDTAASPTSSASVSTGASIYSFNNPSNAFISDGNRSIAGSLLQLFGDETTDYLQVKGFGFNIPAAASICGIQATVVRSATNVDLIFHTSSVKDIDVRLMKNGVLTGTNEAATGVEWPLLTDGNASYGSNSDLWGSSWSPADVNNSNFGFSISAKIHGTAALFPAARINYISITVSYLVAVLSQQTLQFQVANGANNSAALSWKMNTADAAVTYTVERSVNSMKWLPLQGVPQQNSNTSLFTFLDAQPLSGQSYYRLKASYTSGEVRYSTILPYEYIDNLFLKCYPNPASTVVQVAGVIAGERVVLTDLCGKLLFLSAPAKNNMIQLDVAHLQPGMYVISARNRKIKIQKK